MSQPPLDKKYPPNNKYLIFLGVLLLIVISLLLSSCLCVVPGVNAQIGCLPPGYSLYYIDPDQQATEEQGIDEEIIYPYNERINVK